MNTIDEVDPLMLLLFGAGLRLKIDANSRGTLIEASRSGEGARRFHGATFVDALRLCAVSYGVAES